MSSPVTSQSPQKSFPNQRSQGPYQKTNNFFNATPFKQHANSVQAGVEFDGKRLRKAVIRKTIDYNSAIVRQLEFRLWQRDYRDYRAIQPDSAYYTDMTPPPYFVHNAINSVTTKFVRTSTNKMRCPIFCVVWTPEGRRLVTGASSGEFTLWNGLTFNFETILQAHDSPVRNMVWSRNDQWMVTGDHAGFVKYWQSNMNNVKMFQAHKEPLRGISFCPTDHKFATCSDDGTVRIWDFLRCYEERILRGHGADVKSVSWHPQKSLLVSGSKDSQQPIKFWDPKSGQSLATLHAHKSTVMEVKWNSNGNWLLTGSRDHLIKLFDIRKLSQEVRTFRGHKKEVTSLAWHPIHESLFASGGSDGAVMFWLAGIEKEVGAMEQAHDSIVWSLAWHPLGHILCSGSNDHTCKFWTRNRPGDKMRDKYNLNILTGANSEEAAEYDDVITAPSIPGMGLEYVQGLNAKLAEQSDSDIEILNIPGLDFGSEEPQQNSDNKAQSVKKVPYSKPIPKQFQQQWMENKRTLLVSPNNRLSPNPTEMARGGPPLPAPGPPFPPRMMGPDQLGPPRGLLPPGPPMWRPPFPGHLDGPIGGNMSMDIGPNNPRMPDNSSRHNFMGPQGGFHGFPPDKENKNWKDYSDSDFRRPMDSDFRVPSNSNKQDENDDFFSGNGQSDSHEQIESEREDEHDQDLRYSHSHDNSKDDGRGQTSNDLNNVNNREGDKSFGRGSKNNRAHSRWDPPSTRDGMGSSNSSHFNPPGNFPSNDQSPRMFPRDWDERLPGGSNSSNDMGSDGPSGPMFSGMRKRGWNDGPGGDSFDPNLPPNNQRNMGFNRGGGNAPMYNFPQHPPPHPPPPPYGPNRWISPWGPNRGMRPDMRGMRGRGPPGPGPGPNMRGGFGWGGY